MIRLLILLLPLLLPGCGMETAGTAAIVAAEKQQEIEQGRQLKERVQQQLDAAAQAEQQRLRAMEAAASGN